MKEGDHALSDPDGTAGVAAVPSGLEDAVCEAAGECPGECIFIET